MKTSEPAWILLTALWSQFALAEADWVLRGGVIYSMDDTASHYSAMAFKGNRLTWLGESEAAAAQIGPETQIIELEGRTVLPGFIDTHIHSMDTLPLVNGVKVSPYDSPEQVLEKIAEHARTHPYQNPLLGSGFLAPAFGMAGPTAAQLDAIVPDRPALIIDEGGHTGWANTLALEAAGISRDTPDPVPGAHFFQRDEEGNPTGWLVEGAAIDPVTEALGVISEAAMVLAAPGFFKEMSAVGLTAAFDAGMIDTGELGEITNYRGRFFSMYGADPMGLLSWRFMLDEAGHGVSSDILSHSVDLAHMLIGGIEKVVGTGHIQIPERPLPKPGGTHYDTGKPGDPTGTVENEDYFGAMCVFENGARGVFETSRSIVGPQSQCAFEVYGTKGSLMWNLETMNELKVFRASEPELGFKTVYSGDRFPYHGNFVPGDANPIGYEDLKVIEEFEFLSSVANGRQHTPGFAEAIDYVSVQDAMLRSWESEKWETVERLSPRD